MASKKAPAVDYGKGSGKNVRFGRLVRASKEEWLRWNEFCEDHGIVWNDWVRGLLNEAVKRRK